MLVQIKTALSTTPFGHQPFAPDVLADAVAEVAHPAMSERKAPVIIHIPGGSGIGKTTAVHMIAEMEALKWPVVERSGHDFANKSFPRKKKYTD